MKDYKLGQLKKMYHQIFVFAINSRYTLSDPTRGIRLPRPEQHVRDALSEAAQATLLASYEGKKDELFVRATLALGSRPEETAGLTWDDISFPTNIVHICRIMDRRMDANGKWELFLNPKCKNLRDRDIILDDETIALLAAEKRRQEELKNKYPHRWNTQFPNLVFIEDYGDPVKYRDIAKRFRAHCDKLGDDFKYEDKLKVARRRGEMSRRIMWEHQEF